MSWLFLPGDTGARAGFRGSRHASPSVREGKHEEILHRLRVIHFGRSCCELVIEFLETEVTNI